MDAIPVANIYFLLCYAWKQFAPDELNEIANDPAADILELFSRILVNGVRSLHRRGFEAAYVEHEEVLSQVRGRIRISGSLALRATAVRRLLCSHDELTANILRNQILKTTLSRVLTLPHEGGDLRREVRSVMPLLYGFDCIKLTHRLFREAQSRRGNGTYAFLMNICYFLFESLQAEESDGTWRFQSVLRDPRRMRRIFEQFVRNFLAWRQSAYAEVKAEQLEWSSPPVPGCRSELLPKMMTDVTLRSGHRTVVIECKYTPSLLQPGRYGDLKLRSSHLYQLSAYLRTMESNGGPDAHADGILLYPAARITLDERFVLHGHAVRVKTLDLHQHWTHIESELLGLLP